MHKKISMFFISFILTLLVFISCVSCKKTEKENAEKVGVVLSGGGAKGAYEIGVWKAFEEYGITENVKAISGTSVGALNAALFVCTDTETQKEIWSKDVGYFSFMMPDMDTIFSAGKSLADMAIESQGRYGFELKEFGLKFLRKIGKGVLNYAFNDDHTSGLFDRAPLRKIMEKNISLKKINDSGVDVYATALEKKAILLQYMNNEESCLYSFLLNEQTDDKNICDILMASSALPGVYQSQTLAESVVADGITFDEEKEFVDGGFSAAGGENTPLRPLLKYKDLEKIFIVYLRHDPTLRKFNEGESSAQIIHIVPSVDLGDTFDGTINFSADKISSLIELGYKDASEVLESNGYKKNQKQ